MENRDKNGRFIKGSSIQLGMKRTDEQKARISLAHIGISNGKHSEETKLKMRNARLGRKMSLETKQKLSIALKGKMVGPKHHRWKGGPNNEYDKTYGKIRRSQEYRLWRKAVLERDNYTCIWCGSNIRLEADHIKGFCDFPELRFAIDNGRTLCRECHKKTDTYGRNKWKK